jgi:hypothetical protein
VDDKNNPPVLNKGDAPEIGRVMGGRKGKVLSSLNPANPGKVAAPSKPRGVPPTPKGAIAPIFPIVAEEDVHLYQQEKRKPDEIFGFEQHGKIDKELNEYALKEIAAERGMTVEQLLQSNPDKTLEKKLEFANMSEQQPPNPPAGRQAIMTPEQARQMARAAQEQNLGAENAKLRAEIEKLRGGANAIPKPESQYEDTENVLEKIRGDAEQHARAVEERIARKISPKSQQGVPPAVRQHPLLKKLRQKLSIDALEPAEVVVEGFKFGMLPPPGSLQNWLVGKITNGRGMNSQEALAITIRTALVCGSLCFVDGEHLAHVLGLCSETADTETPEVRELLAQTLWEMAVDRPSIDGLFKLHPQLITTLYAAYDRKYSNLHLSSSLDDKLHRYTCPVTGCQETFDIEPPADGKSYCRVHGIEMKDNGSLKEINSLPLS